MDKTAQYINGFILPIPREHLEQYRAVAEKVATIWKEHGALAYFEYVGEDLDIEGLPTFPELLKAKADEAVIFGWTVFQSRAERDKINKLVVEDPRMTELVAPLTRGKRMIFDAGRMVFGGFQPLVYSPQY